MNNRTMMDLVNWMEGFVPNNTTCFAGFFSSGKCYFVASAINVTPLSGWEHICTIEEYKSFEADLMELAGADKYIEYVTQVKNDIEKLEPEKPVFTQVMKDAGELPKVGMRCMWSQWTKEPAEEIEILAVDGCETWIKTVGGEYSTVGNISGCKPIDQRTQQQKQVDIVTNEVMVWSNLKYDKAKAVAEWLQGKGLLRELEE